MMQQDPYPFEAMDGRHWPQHEGHEVVKGSMVSCFFTCTGGAS